MPGHYKTASRLRSRSNFRSYPLKKHHLTNPKSNSSLGKYRVKGHQDLNSLDQYNEKTKPKTKTSTDKRKIKTRKTRKRDFTRSRKSKICHKNRNHAVKESIESIPKKRRRSKTVAKKMSVKTQSRLKIATKRSRGESLARSRSQTPAKIPRKRLSKLRRSSRNLSQVEAKKSKASGTNLVDKIEKVLKIVVNGKGSKNRMKTKSSMCKCDGPDSSNERLFSVNKISAELRSSKRNLCKRYGSIENTAASVDEVRSETLKSEVNDSVNTLNSTEKKSLSKSEKLGKSQLSIPSRNVLPAVSVDVNSVLKLEQKQTKRKKKASDMNIADLKNVKVKIKQENVQLKRKISRKRPHSNPFINFLRQLKKKHQDWHTCKVAIEGSRKWCAMADKDRVPFAPPGFYNTTTFCPIIHKNKTKIKNAAINAVKPSRTKSVNRRANSSERHRQVK